jgi:hypothetical protein
MLECPPRFAAVRPVATWILDDELEIVVGNELELADGCEVITVSAATPKAAAIMIVSSAVVRGLARGLDGVWSLGGFAAGRCSHARIDLKAFRHRPRRCLNALTTS